MNVNWRSPFIINFLETHWDDMPSKSGIYIIWCGRSIPRAGAVDKKGILYVGKSSNLRNRLWDFWYANHPASGMLWAYPKIATTILKKTCRNKKDVEYYLGKLTVRVAYPMPKAMLEVGERAVLYAYFLRFGELPPLNSSLPKRWREIPSASNLRWASRGLK